MFKMLGVGSNPVEGQVDDIKVNSLVVVQENDKIDYIKANDRLIIPRNRDLYTPDLRAMLASLTYTVQGMYTTHGSKRSGAQTKSSKGHHGGVNSVRTPSGDGHTWAMFSMSPPRSVIGTDIGEQIYTVSQEVDLGVIHITSGAIPTFSTQMFTASQLDQVTTFTALFDQYRVNWIELWVEPLQTTNVVTNLASVIDYDDATNLTTYPSALDYNNVVVAPLTNGHHRVFTPHVAVAMYSGAFTSFGNEISPWIDAASTGVQHYGVKLAAETSTGVYNIHGRFRVNVSWRNCR